MIIKMQIFIVRPDCRIGHISVNGDVFTTLDLGTKSSFLPPDTYRCMRVTSYTYGKTFEIVVGGHKHVYFHNGNYPRDTKGCILIGRGYDPTTPMILHSKTGFSEFIKLLQNVITLDLTIEYV
jgi:hypothetical protein